MIITTIKPLAIIAQSAVGDQARVEYLQSAVQSAHEVSLPVSALKKIDQADLIIWIGEMFESRVAKPMALVAQDKRITVMQLPLIAPQDNGSEQEVGSHIGHMHTHDESAHSESSAHSLLSADPHVWLNPTNANRIAAEIQQRLNLPLKDIITAEQIAKLTTELASLRDRQFLVHHDALGHFTSTFKLQSGLSIRDASGASQGVRSQYRLRQQAIASAASCIFIEPQYADRDAQVIAQDLSLPVALIDLQGLDQALVGDAYASFMGTLAQQFKSCFTGL
ncbi:zinc ABC transporter substrate-binding protein [Porticoccaceae bacterium]|nr:zinc ABC transporter substrate-binding protein [Porticoccaceae bacterium]MDC0010255.1 zinc ABC transporter substrate-binding protein [Porticoccaceae bacterium]